MGERRSNNVLDYGKDPDPGCLAGVVLPLVVVGFIVLSVIIFSITTWHAAERTALCLWYGSAAYASGLRMNKQGILTDGSQVSRVVYYFVGIGSFAVSALLFMGLGFLFDALLGELSPFGIDRQRNNATARIMRVRSWLIPLIIVVVAIALAVIGLMYPW